ncbi:MAG: caspase family protein, partial [Bacteroidales bacterium]|nr:caspase family protein [Bacteroidales bacterium]
MFMTLGSKSYVNGGNTRDRPYGLCKISPDRDLIWGGLGVYLMQKRVLASQYITSGNTCASLFGSNRIAAGKGDGKIHIFDRNSTQLIEKKQVHQAKVNSITQHPSGNLAMATSEDRTISLFRTDTNELVAYLMTCNKGHDYIIRTPDNYYMSSQYGTDAIHFAVGTESYNFDQFDLKYNRPDIVLSRIGLAEKKQIDLLYNAYQKRLRRMNYTEEMLSSDFHVPTLKIANAQQLSQAKDPQQEIKIEASDSKYKINSVNVWINGVPVYGMSGKSVDKKKSITLSLPVTLASGHNTIQVSCMNDKGAESYRETVEVNLPVMTGKPHLWIATIGVSMYADQRFNLTYAAKDAKDIEYILSTVNRKDYEEIHTLSLTDVDVTRDNLNKVREFLSKAGRNDAAVLFYAGHGLIDQSYDYFLGTYDTDFANPSQHSIPYEDFESLLDGISPLRKLLLLDACHSGEIDKEDVKMAQANNTSLVKQGITFRNAGIHLPQAVSTTAEEIDELLSDNFSKLQRGSGATIISSSSGLQVSREGDRWNNGLFTYCLIQGLNDEKCDEDHDGKISTRELQSYCATQVQQLSNGNQRPSTRRENRLLDFNIGVLTEK